MVSLRRRVVDEEGGGGGNVPTGDSFETSHLVADITYFLSENASEDRIVLNGECELCWRMVTMADGSSFYLTMSEQAPCCRVICCSRSSGSLGKEVPRMKKFQSFDPLD